MKFNFFFTASPGVYSERRTAPRQKFIQAKSCPAGLVSGWATLKYRTRCRKLIDPQIIAELRARLRRAMTSDMTSDIHTHT